MTMGLLFQFFLLIHSFNLGLRLCLRKKNTSELCLVTELV